MDFLQSKIWRDFQASVGRKVFNIEDISIIEHELPLVGKYFYIPRGPEIHEICNIKHITSELIKLAKDKNIGWVRVEPNNQENLDLIKKSIDNKIVKAPHDMQPRETFVIDISKSEEELLSEMKQKTRYNLNLAKKKDIKIIVSREKKYIDEFLRLVKITSERDGIKSHEEKYYRKMIETIPAENLKIYLAEYDNKIIVANLIVFFKKTAIYLHGASDNEFRNVMAPYLLQWQQINDAKKKGCEKYDFGGIKSEISNSKNQIPNKSQISNLKSQISGDWAGITRFKLGFSPNTEPTRFPGCYDIVLKPLNYALYRTLQKIKTLF